MGRLDKDNEQELNPQDITRENQESSVHKAFVALFQESNSLDLSDLMRSFLDKAEKLTGSRSGFLQFLGSDQKTIEFQTWSTKASEPLAKAPSFNVSPHKEVGGICAECVLKKQAVIHEYDSKSGSRRLLVDSPEVQRELVVPLFRGDEIRAILGFRNKRTPYQEQDIQILRSFADLAWNVISWREREAKLEQEIKQKDSLLSEVHHRIKNNLYSLESLLELQAAESESAETIMALKNALRRVGSIKVLYQNLYLGNVHGPVNMENYIPQLVQNIQDTYDRPVEMLFSIEPIQLSYQDSLSVGNLITEILCNSYKYAFPRTERARFTIEFMGREDRYHLNIKDNGPGFCFDEESTGFGSELIGAMAYALGASWERDCENGCQYRFQFSPRLDVLE